MQNTSAASPLLRGARGVFTKANILNPQTTQSLFQEIINERGAAEHLQINDTALRNLRRNFKLGKVSEDKMNEILRKAGYTIVQERLWAETN